MGSYKLPSAPSDRSKSMKLVPASPIWPKLAVYYPTAVVLENRLNTSLTLLDANGGSRVPQQATCVSKQPIWLAGAARIGQPRRGPPDGGSLRSESFNSAEAFDRLRDHVAALAAVAGPDGVDNLVDPVALAVARGVAELLWFAPGAIENCWR